MGKKTKTKTETVAFRVNPPTNDAIESYAEEYEMSKGEALRAITKDHLAAQGKLEKDIRSKAVTDGGVEKDVHELQSQAADLEELVREQTKTSGWFNTALSIAILWVILQSTIGFSDFVTLVTGVVVLLIVLLGTGPTLYNIWTSQNE